MKKIFLDFGTHKGEGLLHFVNHKMIDKDFEVHTFEASPSLDTANKLDILQRTVENFPQNIKFYNCAVWIENTELVFNNRGDEAAHIEDSNLYTETFFEERGHNTVIVKAIDIAEFIDTLPNDAYIICKMDIEGSEFQIMRYLINKDCIKKIKKFYIEFHVGFTKNETDSTVHEIMTEIRNLGIEVEKWI